MSREQIKAAVYEKKIIAIVRGIDKSDMLNLAGALYEGGIRMVEITFDQSDPKGFYRTTDAIAMLTEAYGDRMLIGAGTVTTPELVTEAVSAGAGYIISPDVKQGVIEKTRELGAVSMPGAMTSTEATDAYKYGADFVKIFPAAQLGTGYIKAIRGPLSHIPFLAVGGINDSNLKEFLDAGYVGAGIGGNLADKKLIAGGRFDEITRLAKTYCNIALGNVAWS